MAWIADGTLAAAVSQVGGLGILAVKMPLPVMCSGRAGLLCSRMDRPSGVDILLISPLAGGTAAARREARGCRPTAARR